MSGGSQSPNQTEGQKAWGTVRSMMFSIQVLILEQKDTVHKFGELTVISKQKV